MVVSTDNEKDQWLREQLREYAKPVTRRDVPGGIVYQLRKAALLKKRKKFDAEVVFRDGEHLLRTMTRPGFFRIAKSILVVGSCSTQW